MTVDSMNNYVNEIALCWCVQFTIPSVQHLLPEYCHLLLQGYPVIFLSQICGLPTVDHTLHIIKGKRKKERILMKLQ